MHKKRLCIFTNPLIILVLFSGCSKKPAYKLSSLEPRTGYDQVIKATEHGAVTVRSATCTRRYMRELFGKQSDALFGLRSHKRIIPVQLYIENNSDTTWSLSPFDIHTTLADMDLVKARFYKAAASKGLASLGTQVTLGLVCISVGTAASIMHPIIGASIFGAGCSMIITAPVFSHKKAANIAQQNAQYAHSLDTLTLSDTLFIHPHERVNRLIFIEQPKISNKLELRLCDVADSDRSMLYQLYIDPRIRKA